ncbi:MAG: energy-coupling factor ABC transporter substrate-binding protein [Candidatus Caldatribacteriaceae bacterium]
MSKRNPAKLLYGIFIGVLAILAILSVGIDLGLSGTDDQASEAISELRPDHVPWFSPLLEPSELAERLLFSMQLAFGVGLGIYFFLRIKTK